MNACSSFSFIVTSRVSYKVLLTDSIMEMGCTKEFTWRIWGWTCLDAMLIPLTRHLHRLPQACTLACVGLPCSSMRIAMLESMDRCEHAVLCYPEPWLEQQGNTAASTNWTAGKRCREVDRIGGSATAGRAHCGYRADEQRRRSGWDEFAGYICSRSIYFSINYKGELKSPWVLIRPIEDPN